MHHFTIDNFRALEFGLADRTLGFAASPVTPTSTIGHRTVTVGGGQTQSVPVTPTDQAKEAIKDGTISTSEQTVFDSEPVVMEVVLGEQHRLFEAVLLLEGNDYRRTETGELELVDGKPVRTDAYGYDPEAPTEHEQRVATLGENQNADELQTRITNLEAQGVTTGVAELKQQLASRLAEEAKVVDVIVEKTSYLGTLEAEKAVLAKSGGGTTDGANDYQVLREEAQGPLEQFIAADGQVHESDWVGDDWDNIDADPEDAAAQFDKLAKYFKENPDKLDEWVKHQGDSNDGIDDMAGHIAGIDDPELQDKVALRYEAALKLKAIFERYNVAHESNDGASNRMAQLDGEIAVVNDSLTTDKAVLSTKSNTDLTAQLAPVEGIIPETAAPAPAPTEEGGDATPSTDPEGTDAPPSEEEPPSDPSDGGVTPGGDPALGEEPAPGTNPPVTAPGEVPIDYSTPQGREQVLTMARERGLLPAANVTFDAAGDAIYAVQTGDSYVSIADMTDGQPPHVFDPQHFLATLNLNSERLGRDPALGELQPLVDEVVIPGRSLKDLIVLLGLPETEVPATVGAAAGPGQPQP